jgi:hypothetical protein
MVGLLVFLHALKHTYLYEEYLLGDEGLMWPIKNNKDSTDMTDAIAYYPSLCEEKADDYDHGCFIVEKC